MLRIALAMLLLVHGVPAVFAQAGTAGSSAADVAQRLRIDVHPSRPEQSAPVQIHLSDLHAVGCPTRVETVERVDATVTVRMAHGQGCTAADAQAMAQLRSAPTPTLQVRPQIRWGGQRVHRVRIEDDGGPSGAPRLLAFRLIEVGAEQRTIVPEPGNWWNEAGGEFDHAGPGLGLNLERQGDTLSVTVLGYAADGRPEWLFGAGAISGRIATVPLSRLEGGSGPFDPYLLPDKAENAGVLHLEFHSGARAVGWFERAAEAGGIQLLPLSLVRFRFDHDHANAWLGEWLLVGTGGAEPEAARTLRLQSVHAFEHGFRLNGDDGTQQLECHVDRNRPNSPPDRCVLRDDAGVLQVDFRDIAVDRMHGWRPDGTSVTALRRPQD